MSTRLNVILSDDLDQAIETAVADAQTTKSELFRKALQLYLAAQDGKRRGLKLGLVEPESGEMKTEIVGL